MLTKSEMERFRMLHDLLFVHYINIPGMMEDYHELAGRSSEVQCREVGFVDDAEAAVAMFEAADQGRWRRRPPVKVLSLEESVHLPEFSGVRSPGWREAYARYLKLVGEAMADAH